MKKDPFLPVGSSILNRSDNRSYTLKAVIGQGGFAQCYEVVDNQAQAKYAAKIIRKADLTKPKNRQKLLTEIKIHLSVHHKHIVKLHNYFEDKSFVFLVMELCPNKSVMDLLRKTKRMEERHAKIFIAQILSALEYLHNECSVVHRDMKLGNLFLDEGFNIKVGDFGLAALIDSEERKKTICGTPNYIAPEVLFNSEGGHSFEVDIWSLGVILYTLLVGKPPFQKNDVKEIYKSIKTNSYEFPPDCSVSEEAKDLIRSLLETDPEKRPKIPEIYRSRFLSGVGIQEPANPSGEGRADPCPAEKPPAGRSRSSGLLHRIYTSLSHLLNEGDLRDAGSGPIPSADYIVSTVDYTQKYGLGYLMKSGAMGILFNDCTSIFVRYPLLSLIIRDHALLGQLVSGVPLGGESASMSVEYFEHKVYGTQKIITKDKYSINRIPEQLHKKILLVNYFVDGMRLRSAPPTPSLVREQAFVIKHVVFLKGPVLRLSNRVIVFMFADGGGVVFLEEGRVVIRSERGERRALSREELLYCQDVLAVLLRK